MWSNSDVCCWRELTENDVEEMINEAKEDGMYDEMQDDIEKDRMRSKHFDTISIGKRGVYKEI